LDGQFLKEPGCIICSDSINKYSISTLKHNRYCLPSKLLYVNPRLTQDWLVTIRGQLGDDQAVGLTLIGRYGERSLYTNNLEHYHQFLLFILEATNLGTTTGQSGKNSAPSRLSNPTPAQPSFVIPPM
jgi:hypothetical protein